MRLSDATLEQLPPAVRRPDYDRRAVEPGIVHLGLGAFFRAHGAAYTDAVLGRDLRWGIVAASLRSPEARDALEPQGGLYTLAVRSAAGEALRVIGALGRVLVAQDKPNALVSALADPRTRIVTLTVTEKGYCHDPATGELNEAHPEIRRDLADPGSPRTAPGLIVEALRRRRAAGVPPFTVLSCDNLPSNGVVAKRILDRYAALVDPELGAVVAGELVCPCSMVDRITPATTEADRRRTATRLRLIDAWPVVTEPFSQWVIEDRFGLGRPPWEVAGAEFVQDVAPFELMKLRLLNGAHSTLAYLGYLAGYETVAETMADPAFVTLARGVMDEATPTLTMPAGVDLERYKAALCERFSNPALKHRTWQICMDGSQKLPQRLLGSIRDCMRLGKPFKHLALGVAGWMRYVTGLDENGAAIDVRDPVSARLRSLSEAAGRNSARLTHALIGVESIFGSDLAGNAILTDAISAALSSLWGRGARATVGDLTRASRGE